MAWEIKFTPSFEKWWQTLEEKTQDGLTATINLLAELGPNLPFPYSSGIKAAGISRFRELRISRGGKPYRIIYAFDPERSAILLAGGDKTSDNRFYEKIIKIAESEYIMHLENLKGA
jgi:hypothetical protein